MRLIQPSDIEGGDVQSILRFLLGLIRHYQPHLVQRKRVPIISYKTTKNYNNISNSPQSLQRLPIFNKEPTIKSNQSHSNISPIKSKLQRLISTQRSKSEMSNIIVKESRARRLSDSDIILNQWLLKDIQDIHLQLMELTNLFCKPNIVCKSNDKIDKICQTEKMKSKRDRFSCELNYLTTNLQNQLNNNNELNLNVQPRCTECLPNSQTNINEEFEDLNPLIAVLQSVKQKRKLSKSSQEKCDKGIQLLKSLSQSIQNSMNKKDIIFTNSFPEIHPDIFQSHFLKPSKDFSEKSETQLICFLQKSAIPYLTTIPLASSKITLAYVQKYIKSLLPQEINYRYFFETINPMFGPAKEEIIRDQDFVPLFGDKIIVFVYQQT